MEFLKQDDKNFPFKQGDKIKIVDSDGNFVLGEFHRYGQSRHGAIAFVNGTMRFVDEQSLKPF